jgi:hypothetical protein
MIHPLFAQLDEKLGDYLSVVNACKTAEDPAAYGESVTRRIFLTILPYNVGNPGRSASPAGTADL